VIIHLFIMREAAVDPQLSELDAKEAARIQARHRQRSDWTDPLYQRVASFARQVA
jgi:hypothetical protein